VSEAGFTMEDEKLQLLIGLFKELKTDINDVKTELKTDISAMNAGQEELRNDMKAVKGNISALETKINAGQEELR
jgi:outer membrane murein-binding lipoprotein Lpp